MPDRRRPPEPATRRPPEETLPPDSTPFQFQDTQPMTVPGHVALPEAESVGWAEFEAARAGFDSRFAETQPMSVLPGGMKAAAAPAPRPARARSYTVDEVMVLARRNNRVCPRPGEWERLYELLPNKRRTSHGWQPSAPLVGGAWSVTSWMLERLTLREHIEWASSQGVLPSGISSPYPVPVQT